MIHTTSLVLFTLLYKGRREVPDMGRESEGVLNYEFIITFCAGMIIVGLFVDDFSLVGGRAFPAAVVTPE